jgi:putative tyrosine kinase-like protein
MIPEVSVRSASSAVSPPYPEDEGEALRRWSGVLAHGWGVLAIGAVAGALIAWLAAARTPPVFEAVSTVVLNRPSETSSGLFVGSGMRAIFTGPTVLSRTVGALALDRPPYSLTAAAFGNKCLIVEEIATTYVTRLRVRLPDAQTAATAATAVAQNAIDLTAEVWRNAIALDQAALEKQLVTAQQQLAKAEQEWLTARLATGRGTGRAEGVRVPRGIAPNQEKNPSPPFNQQSLEERLRESRVSTASTPSGQQYATEFELVRLENEVEVRRKVYMDVAERLEKARVQLTATTSPLQLVERAEVPKQPLPRASKRTVALGFLAGLVLAACLVVSREWRLSTRKHVR